MFSELKIILISAAAIITLSLSFYWYYSYSQDKISTLQDNVKTYKESNESKDKVIAAQDANFTKAQNELKLLNNKFSLLLTENDKLKQSFKIGVVTSANKQALEIKVNNDYNTMFLQLNELTNPEKFSSHD